LEFENESADEDWEAEDDFYEAGGIVDPNLESTKVRFSAAFVEKDTVIEAIKYRTLKTGKKHKTWEKK
jgi:hypothetical protein